MALPSLDKTWQFDINQELLTTGTTAGDSQQFHFALKNSLIGFASNAWTVVASSDGVVAGAGDNWTVVGDLVWGAAPADGTPGAAHSWIQLRQAGVSSNFEVVFDLSFSSGPSARVFWSGTGFSGGATTNRPTASDEVVMFDGNWLRLNGASDQRFHVMQSTDGECTRFFMFNTWNVRAIFCVIFDKAKNPVPGWTVPAISLYCEESSGNINTYGQLNDNNSRVKGYHGKQINFYVTSEFYQGSAVGEQQTFPNDIDGNFPLMPVGLFSTTSGVRGRHGQVFDLWWGSTAVTQYGGSYPEGTGRQFVHFGNLVFPWNGSVMLRYGGI